MGKLALIGAPTSAGAFAPGQEKAPDALRQAGLVERLTAAGIVVHDLGDTPRFRWTPDPAAPSAQNVDVVSGGAADVARLVEKAYGSADVVLVLGGDCTIEFGTVSGMLGLNERIGLVYYDMHPDLNVPSSVHDGTLDWMGTAHMLGVDGSDDRFSRSGPRHPLLEPEQVFLFGWRPEQSRPWELEQIERLGLDGIELKEVAADPEGAAAKALEYMAARFDRVLVHFDVDIVDFVDAPLSENTGRNIGLTLDRAMTGLHALMSDAVVATLTVTELNPDHGAEDGSTLRSFTERLVDALSAHPSFEPSHS
jgi:arginase